MSKHQLMAAPGLGVKISYAEKQKYRALTLKVLKVQKSYFADHKYKIHTLRDRQSVQMSYFAGHNTKVQDIYQQTVVPVYM